MRAVAPPPGRFEPCPANPSLSHRGTDHPIQNTGHADLVRAPDGSWCMVLLGVRPRGGTPGWHVLGRETFLTRVSWVDDWPVVADLSPTMAVPWPLYPVPATATRDDFDGALAPRRISLRLRPVKNCTVTDRPGWLTLRAGDSSLDDLDGVFVGRRQQHLSCRARTLIDPARGRGSLAVRLDDAHHYEVEAGDGEVRVITRVGSSHAHSPVSRTASRPAISRNRSPSRWAP